jgi:hypothetical protein
MRASEKTINLYEKALKWMPKKFTSHYFTKRLRGLGVSEVEIQNDYYYKFLLEECVNVKKMHWEKKDKVVKVEDSTSEESVSVEEPTKRKYNWQKRTEGVQQTINLETPPVVMTEEQMIEHLKANGYKVLKQIWNEL